MTKVAIGSWNEQLRRWEAKFNGKILASSRDAEGGPEYLAKVIKGGFSQKAKNHDVTEVEIVPHKFAGGTFSFGTTPEGDDAGDTPALRTVEQEFPINERFRIMQEYTEMVGEGDLASALVTGEGGLGKTFTVMKAIRALGLNDISEMEVGARMKGKKGYIVVKGYSTAKGLFRTLYENRKQLIIFDDCDSVLRDPTAVNLLKAALDSYDKRIVSWNAEASFGGDDDMPKQFEFTGGVIFISNMSKHKVPQAIRSRAMCADVSMTRHEVIERMRVIAASDEFMPEYDESIKLEALDFVGEQVDNPLVASLNLRTLVNTVKMRASKPNSWKRNALYDMANSA